MINLLEKEFFICDKCAKEKSTDGALMGRDPRIQYNICEECRHDLVKLLSDTEIKTILSFLQPERLNPKAQDA